MKTVERLVELKQRDAAVGYMNFVRELIPRTAEQDLKNKLNYYMELSAAYQKFHMPEESLAELKKALELKKTEGTAQILEFVQEHSKNYLDKDLLQSAQDLVNTAVTLLGPAELLSVAKMARQFAEDLFPSKNYRLALDYVNYAYTQYRTLTDADPHDAINMIVHFVMLFLEEEEIENVTDYVSQLIPIFIQFYQYTG